MVDSKQGQGLIMYGFIGGLLVLMAVMLATTPVPEWMDGSGDEGPQVGGPQTHRQEKRMPWTYDNGEGPEGGGPKYGGGPPYENGEGPEDGEDQEEDPYDNPEVQGYGARTLAKERKGTYGMHTTGREYQRGELAQKVGSRQRQLSARSGALKNPLSAEQLRAVTHARQKSKAFYTQGDKTVPV